MKVREEMINPLTMMKVINERHEFVKNHREVFPFLKENLGGDLEVGTVMEISIKSPSGKESIEKIKIEESDLPLLKAMAELIGQIA